MLSLLNLILMVAKVLSAATSGVDAVPVEIEVNEGRGLLAVVIVGLPDTGVKESRDRVKTALENSGFKFPLGRTTINLAPADLKKEGPSFDLPMALGILAASGQLETQRLQDYYIVGELALNGAIRSVRGVLSIALEARRRGLRGVIIPEENAVEAAVVEGIEAIPVKNLRQTVEWLVGKAEIFRQQVDLSNFFHHHNHDVDFSEVKGQQHVKRALEIAAAGGHNCLMVGPPGSGKSMLAKRLPTILPPLTLDEALETTKIHSIAGLLNDKNSFVKKRPFRAPHHTISDVGLVGGGADPSPGEISLAHHGVLFLDELPEFKRFVLEVMRQPLEEGKITISRAAGTMTFPAQIMLVAAMNPTPDGKSIKDSKSTPNEIRRYLAKISGPLLDRIDLHVEVSAVKISDLSQRSEPAESSAAVRERVQRARYKQHQRFSAGKKKLTCNAQMGPKELRQFCLLDSHSEELLKNAMLDMNLSARAYDRILKVARTIADLADAESIHQDHLFEALQYRSLDRELFS